MPYADPAAQRAYLKKYSRTWYWRNRDKDLARQKAWRAANRDKLQIYRQAFRAANGKRLAAEQRKRREADPERIALIDRKSSYKTQYGLTLEQFAALLAKQGGRCAVCGTDKPGGRWATFAVDHCHNSNIVRGLLCLRCNTNLGHYEGWYLKHEAKIRAYLAK